MKKSVLFLLMALLLNACPINSDTEIPEFILAGEKSGAGIRHIRIHPPDSLYHSHPSTAIARKIDLDGNGKTDFEISFYTVTSPGGSIRDHSIRPIQPGNAIATHFENTSWALPLQLNDTIGPELQWHQEDATLTYERFLMGQTESAGLWFDHPMAFVGVKLEQGNKTRYGWIAIGTTNLWWDMVIREYAIR